MGMHLMKSTTATANDGEEYRTAGWDGEEEEEEEGKRKNNRKCKDIVFGSVVIFNSFFALSSYTFHPNIG